MRSHYSSVGRCCCASFIKTTATFIRHALLSFTLYHHVSHLISRTHFPAQALILLKFESPFLSMSSSTGFRAVYKMKNAGRSDASFFPILISPSVLPYSDSFFFYLFHFIFFLLSVPLYISYYSFAFSPEFLYMGWIAVGK